MEEKREGRGRGGGGEGEGKRRGGGANSLEAKEKTKGTHCITEHKSPAATTGAASLLALLLAKFQFTPQHVLFHLQTGPWL